MTFAFLIMGDFDRAKDAAAIHGGAARIVGVSDMREAEEAARLLAAEGVGCIELCGAFGEENARKIVAATGNKIPVGYVTRLPEQDDVYKRAFPDG